MKDLLSLLLQASVRNQLESFDKGIVSYIPLKFASQNLTNIAFCQKLPTAYFSCLMKFMNRFEEWRIFAPVVHFCTRRLQSVINSKICPSRFYINLSQNYLLYSHTKTLGG